MRERKEGGKMCRDKGGLRGMCLRAQKCLHVCLAVLCTRSFITAVCRVA